MNAYFGVQSKASRGVVGSLPISFSGFLLACLVRALLIILHY